MGDAGLTRGVAVPRACVASFLLAAALLACGERPQRPAVAEPGPLSYRSAGGTAVIGAYVGSAACAACHPAESELWKTSDHALAMQEAIDATVLGDFRNRRVTARGVTSTFARKDGGFIVATDGPDGVVRPYAIAYTFGVTPLQQYLVVFPGGRYQALGLAWDSRPRAAGGQRWFPLDTTGTVDHRHPLHWTAPDQNWNFMCAECHSTDLRRGWDASTGAYATTWKEINVACEACHGPGSRHVTWAAGGARAGDPGLAVRLAPHDPAAWTFDGVHPTVTRVRPAGEDLALETCARCHSRRGWVWEEVRPGAPIADSHRVALLERDLYFDDGQIDGEVYEYGSFLQSRMQRAGVTCADCHDPHSGKPRAAGNLLCGQCHLPSHFDATTHHHHAEGSAGARCVACHMPERTYMVVDPRRDHSLRVPRPDLTVSIGTPNACNACHADRDAAWAAAAVRGWYPAGRSTTRHAGQALHAARTQAPGAVGALLAIVADPREADIVRATALAAVPARAAVEGRDAAAIGATVRAAVRDRSPLVRRTVAEWIESLSPEARARVGAPLLADPIRTVRLAAAASLAGAPPATLGPDGARNLATALDEYRRSLAFNADRADGQCNLGNLERRLDRPAEAEAAYRRALAIDPTFIPAAVNLADLCAASGRDPDGEAVLRAALSRNPADADIEHALGLARIRQRDAVGGLARLRRAAALRPGDARYAFVHAVALHDTGDATGAIAALEEAASLHPNDPDIVGALVSYYTERGDTERAGTWGARLQKLLGG